MLKEGTWDPLPFQSIEDGLGEWGEEEVLGKRGVRKEKEREVKMESGLEETHSVRRNRSRSIQMMALQQRLQDAISGRDHALAARVEADIRDLECGSEKGHQPTKETFPSVAGPSTIAPRDRRHSINGGVGADILNADGQIDDK